MFFLLGKIKYIRKLIYIQSIIFWHETGYLLIPQNNAGAIKLENEFRNKEAYEIRPYDQHPHSLQLDAEWHYENFKILLQP